MAGDAHHPRTTSGHPSLARVYDYYLDGSLNSAIDRHLAEELQDACPAIPRIIQHQRIFLRRSVQHMLQLGVRQFIDLGSGLPTAGHVHHLTCSYDPNIAVAYVDNDPMVVAHGRIILDSTPNAEIFHADLRQPSEVLRHDGVCELIDLSEPVAITMVGVLEFISDHDNPAALIADYRAASEAKTFIALTMLTHANDPDRHRQLEHAAEIYRSAGAQLIVRPPETLHRWLAGMTIVTPASQWSPDAQPPQPPQPDAELTLSALIKHPATSQ
ncbi:MAG TPA: SAM-dependent methyltransferase [Actinophytocola sp.]|uniref:SAM-dependent methyltransferase n=1 Tax=Actinophytocola sp. TaxID=1872138 RepID=UPI002DDD6C32|nr:SAM-dependent methyltransferase [Actinophytocola sp.]HEV2779245.1 SAM-dependent methyltransferase [Actinophytocola sp.]